MKTWFLSFADHRFKSVDLIRNEAKTLDVFDNIIAGDERLFEKWYLRKYKDRFKDRGFGYWQWKSYLIRLIIDRMDEGDTLLYTDAGCVLNANGKKRMSFYFDIVNYSDSGILVFNQHYPETECTKGDVFSFFGVTDNSDYTKHGQVAGGVIFLKKCDVSRQFVDEWYYICHNHYNLIDDSPSVSPNTPDFKTHRHDQSIVSLLAVKYHAEELPVEEIYTNGDWVKEMNNYPIWACRRRKISFSYKIWCAFEKYFLRKK